MSHTKTVLVCGATLTVFVCLGLGMGWMFAVDYWFAWSYAAAIALGLLAITDYGRVRRGAAVISRLGRRVAGIVRACRSYWFLAACAAFLVPCLAFGFFLQVACGPWFSWLIPYGIGSILSGLLWPAPMMLVIFIRRQRRWRASEDGNVAGPLSPNEEISGLDVGKSG